MSDSKSDKAEGAFDKIKGKAKEAFGDVTGDDSKKAEGEGDQTKGELKQTKGDAKDKASDAMDSFKKDN
jgi:uncharacterized protein YjbJ (UPF0337 family)